MEFRIVTNGVKFRVQKLITVGVGWFNATKEAWRDATYPPRLGGNIVEVDTREAAQAYIEEQYLKAEYEAKPWRPA